MVGCSRLLEKLGITPGMVYEVVVSTYDSKGSPHASAMGVVFDGHLFRIKPHINSVTYKNLCSTLCGVINIAEPQIIVECALDLKFLRISFTKAKLIDAPRVEGVAGWIEFAVERLERAGEWGVAICRPVLCEAIEGAPRMYSRAEAALVEAAVHASRIPVYSNLGDEGKVKEFKKLVDMYISLIERIGGESTIVEMARRIKDIYLR